MARVFYIEEIGLVIFTMLSHRKVQTVSVFIINGCLLFYFSILIHIDIISYHIISLNLLYLGVGYSVILLNNYGLIMQEKSLFC